MRGEGGRKVNLLPLMVVNTRRWVGEFLVSSQTPFFDVGRFPSREYQFETHGVVKAENTVGGSRERKYRQRGCRETFGQLLL